MALSTVKTLRQQTAALAALGQYALTASLDDLFNEVARRVSQVLAVEYCKILELLPGEHELHLVAGVGWKPGLVRQANVSAGLDSQAGYTLVSDQPVVVTDLRTETRFRGPPLLLEHGVISGISVVIRGRKHPFGVIGAHTGQQRKFTHDDIEFMTAVANILAAAVEQDRAEKALVASESRYRTITDMVTDFAYVARLGAARNLVIEWQSGDLAERLGYSGQQLTPDFWAKIIHPDDLPVYAQHLERIKQRMVSQYVVRVYDAHGEIHWVQVSSSPNGDQQHPIIYGAIIDVTERKRDEEKIQRAVTRLRILAEISRAFSDASINYQHLLHTVVRRIVEAVGDTCFVLLFADDLETYTSSAYYSSDPQVFEPMREAMNFTALPANSKTSQLIKTTGESVFIPVLTHDEFKTLMRPEVLAAFQHAKPSSFIAMPLRARNRLFGTMYLLRHKQGHAPYTEDDLAMVEVLADRAALAMSNARLYREIQESEHLFRVTFEQAAVGMSHVSMEGRLLHVNERLCEILGYRSDELLQMTVAQLTHPDDVEFEKAYLQTILTNEMHQGSLEKRFLTSDGEIVWGQLTISVVRKDNGEIDYFIGAVEDITARKQAEEEVRRLNAELEQRVIERTARITAINKELEAFSYSVSHDLRTPLRALDGFSMALLEDYSDQLDEEGQFYLRRIRNASQQMGQLIDDLLNLSRLTRSEMSFTTVNLSIMVRNICQAMLLTHPDRQVELRIEEDVTCWGDARLLRILLENLLENAWKFTSKTPETRIEFGVSLYNNQNVYFVRDNGAGFDMAYTGKLFGAFQRLHSTEEFEGTGIGLATVQRIVHRHGGQIWAEGAVGKGATFYFTLSGKELYEQGQENYIVGGR